MNKTDTIINKLEKAGLITVVVIWILRAWFGPVFNFSLLVTTTLLAVYYLWFGFFIFNKLQPADLLQHQIRQSITPFQVTTSILMGIITSYALIAIIFGFFFFPGIQTAIISAYVLIGVFTCLMLVHHILKKKKLPFCRRFYVRITVIGFFLLLLGAPPPEYRLQLLFKDYPEFQQAYLEYRKNPDCEETKNRLREERSQFR